LSDVAENIFSDDLRYSDTTLSETSTIGQDILDPSRAETRGSITSDISLTDSQQTSQTSMQSHWPDGTTANINEFSYSRQNVDYRTVSLNTGEQISNGVNTITENQAKTGVTLTVFNFPQKTTRSDITLKDSVTGGSMLPVRDLTSQTSPQAVSRLSAGVRHSTAGLNGSMTESYSSHFTKAFDTVKYLADDTAATTTITTTLPVTESTTCKHGTVGTYGQCECEPGFTGSECETDFNECDSSPCLNNATCHDLPNRFWCVCHK